ncbi:phage tail fiber protein [Virgibacillus sp. FSP13]
MSFTNYLEAKVLDDNFVNGTVYLALFTSDPGEDGTGTEVSGGGYKRQVINFGAPSGGQITNSAEVRFPIATASYGTITHVGVYDDTDNLVDYTVLDSAREVQENDQFVVDTSGYTISLD